jgi:hypothetical protein
MSGKEWYFLNSGSRVYGPSDPNQKFIMIGRRLPWQVSIVCSPGVAQHLTDLSIEESWCKRVGRVFAKCRQRTIKLISQQVRGESPHVPVGHMCRDRRKDSNRASPSSKLLMTRAVNLVLENLSYRQCQRSLFTSSDGSRKNCGR